LHFASESRLFKISPLFAVAFWIAGMAALFSIARNQIYSFFLIKYFDPENGTAVSSPKCNRAA